jgi:hypothetical protein
MIKSAKYVDSVMSDSLLFGSSNYDRIEIFNSEKESICILETTLIPELNTNQYKTYDDWLNSKEGLHFLNTHLTEIEAEMKKGKYDIKHLLIRITVFLGLCFFGWLFADKIIR